MLNKDAPTPDGEFVHPAESLYRLIARIKYLNPMETDEICSIFEAPRTYLVFTLLISSAIACLILI